MFSHVQGRTDASKAWDEMARKILKSIGLIPTRGDPSLFSGVVEKEPMIICKATDDFGVGTRLKKAYDLVVKTFRSYDLVVHDIGEMSFYFGTRIIITSSCITLDHNHLIYTSLEMMYGISWRDQLPSTTKSPPLPSGSKYELELIMATPFSSSERIEYEKSLGWKYRSILGIWMFMAQRTRWDILPGVLFLSQFQNSPGQAHFDGVKHTAKFLRCHPDVPLVFKRNKSREEINSLCLYQEETKSSSLSECIDYGIEATRSLGDTLLYDEDSTHVRTEFSQDINNLDTNLEEVNDLDPKGRLQPPFTDEGVDANFCGGLTEYASVMGGFIALFGTVIFAFSKKNPTEAFNSTDAEINAAFYMGKVVLWIRQIMEDLGIPYANPTPIAEDNRATQLAANAGQISKRTRHIATQQAALQSFTRSGHTKYYLVKGTSNMADHFTKLLSLPAVTQHCGQMMGLIFLTKEHGNANKKRNQQELLQ